jgi:hypothetical protein
MRRKLIFGVSFLVIAWTFTSCESLSDCGFCKDVTYETGNPDPIQTGTETEYCGQDLVNKKATAPVTVGSLTTKVECR